MQFKSICRFFGLLFLLALSPTALFAQSTGVDAVAISSKYYNSIVKILLYDSVTGKTNPDKAYLGRGSGFFVSDDGYIFTNRHVIAMTYNGFCRYKTYNDDTKKLDDAFDTYLPSMLTDPNISKIVSVGRASIIVQVYTNSKGDSSKLYHAQIIALDTLNFDGAIIKINTDLSGNPVSEKFHAIPLGNSDSTRQGQDLCLFGFPAQYGGDFSVMLKDMSTLIFGKNSGYDFTYNTQYGFIKTDAAINNGNSGGPVFGKDNTVIGIATAAFEKTNVGLIGGIDAMYFVSALIPNLQMQLTAEGLGQPQRRPNIITTALYKPLPLPSPRDIKRANSMTGKKGMTPTKAIVTLNGTYGIAPTNTFSANSFSMGGYSTNAGQNYNISSQEFGLKFRITKPTMFKQKNNLVGYFFDLSPSYYVPNMQSFNAINTTNGTIKMNSTDFSQAELHIDLSFGFCYSYLFKASVSLTAYFGVVGDLNPIDGSTNGGLTIGILTTPTNLQQSIAYSWNNNASIYEATGLIFRFKSLILGLDYHLNNTVKVNYVLPNEAMNSSNNPIVIPGTSKRSLLNATLGFVFH